MGYVYEKSIGTPNEYCSVIRFRYLNFGLKQIKMERKYTNRISS